MSSLGNQLVRDFAKRLHPGALLGELNARIEAGWAGLLNATEMRGSHDDATVIAIARSIWALGHPLCSIGPCEVMRADDVLVAIDDGRVMDAPALNYRGGDE